MLDINSKLDEIQKYFPVGIEIGVKQPCLKVSLTGMINLRNDNPLNIIIDPHNKYHEMSAQDLKAKGNEFFKKQQF